MTDSDKKVPGSDEPDERRAKPPGGDEKPPGEEGEDAGSEDIEILDVTAADESGVPLEDDEDDEPVIVDDDEDEELDVSTEDFDSSPPRATASSADLDAARAQVQELREQLMRTQADFDNFRKRVDRDRVEERKQATAGLVRALLPALDSFRWALVSAQKGDDAAVKGFAEGFRLIETQLIEILKGAGLEAVDATGIFDPTVHEALMQETTTEKPHMQVLEVFEPGWRLGGRLLRPARVKVANNPTGAASEGDTSEAESETTH